MVCPIRSKQIYLATLLLCGGVATFCSGHPIEDSSDENADVLPYPNKYDFEPSQAEENGKSNGFKLALIPQPSKTAESVNLEQEGIPSKVLGVYDSSQQKVADLSNPVPILDTISEHEKYGNNGDMFDGISRSLVNGYEAFSNFLNKVIQKPKDVARQFSKGITDQLNILGGKIVGL